MNDAQIAALTATIKETFDERFEQEQKETLEKVKIMLTDHEAQRSCSSSYDDKFHKVSHYLSMLIDLASRTEHKVHTEIDEAINKLKEMAYS